MAGGGGSKRGKWEEAAAALLAEASIEAAARKARVSTRTLKNWLKDPAFLVLYRDARRAVVEAAVARVQQLTTKAMLTLNRNLECGKPAAEIRAAVALLDYAWRGLETFDLAQQLAELKAQVEAMRHGDGNPGPRGGEAEAGGPASGPKGGGGPGPAAPRPGGGVPAGGDDGRQLADQPPPLFG
jgi:hypothetical protein